MIGNQLWESCEGQARERFDLVFQSVTCRVASAVPLVISWRPKLEPFFTIAESSSRAFDADVCIMTDVDEETWELLHRPGSHGESILLHGQMEGEILGDGVEPTVVRNKSLPVSYLMWREPLRMLILMRSSSEPLRLDALRVLRGLLVELLERRGYRKYHMAVTAIDGCGWAFCGDSGAGKTSFSLASLKQPSTKANFITNDKALLASNGGGLTAVGIPLAVAIGLESLPELPELADIRDVRIINEKAYYWPFDLALAMGREASAAVQLSCLLAVNLDLGQDHFLVKPMSKQEVRKLIAGPVGVFTDNIHTAWLSPFLGPCRVEDLSESIASVPSLRVRGNPWRADWNGLTSLVKEAVDRR